MDKDLGYLIHFFNDKEHLFKTIMMADACEIDEVCDQLVSQRGWYWGRYARSERHDYLNRRRFVERELLEGYTQKYGALKEKAPVYFYLYPRLTIPKAIALGQERMKHEEVQPGILLIKIQDIDDTTNITFTLNDSLTAYRQKLIEAGIRGRGPQPDGIVLRDHNQVIPFSMIEEIHQRYKKLDMVYEVQVWDYELLEKVRYTLLRQEKAQLKLNNACP